MFDDADGRRVVFQVWDWPDDGPTYTVIQFILRERQSDWETNSYITRYRALSRRGLDETLDETLDGEGFADVAWLMPNESGYYQPIVTAHKQYRE